MTIEEYTIRVGQQAVVLCCTPGKQGNSGQSYKVFGSQPLENVVRLFLLFSFVYFITQFRLSYEELSCEHFVSIFLDHVFSGN